MRRRSSRRGRGDDDHSDDSSDGGAIPRRDTHTVATDDPADEFDDHHVVGPVGRRKSGGRTSLGTPNLPVIDDTRRKSTGSALGGKYSGDISDAGKSPFQSRRTSWGGAGTTTSASATPMSGGKKDRTMQGLWSGGSSGSRFDSPHESDRGGHDADTEGADEEAEFASLWDTIMRDDAPTDERPPHIERELKPYRIIGTGVALAVLLWILRHQAFERKTMMAAIIVLIFGEYLSDFSWFQVVSGLSIGMIFAIVIVVLAIVRRYSKPSAVGGAIALGCIKFKLRIQDIIRLITDRLGFDLAQFIVPIVAIAALLLFIGSSIWYCTASFPVLRFQKFLKFFLNIILGGGLICFSFYSTTTNGSFDAQQESFASVTKSWGALFVENYRWIGASMCVYFIVSIALKWAVLRYTVEDISAMVDERYGANKVVPVKNYTGFKSPAEVRRTSQDFTKMQLEKLQRHIETIPREQLADIVSADAYFQLTQPASSPSIVNRKIVIAYAILLLILLIAYAATTWASGDPLFEIPR